jgi:hypothetical protein
MVVVARSSQRQAPHKTNARLTRPPVLIQIGNAQVRAGLVGQAHAKTFVSFEPTRVNTSSCSSDSSAVDFYSLYAPLLEQALALVAQDCAERRAIVVFDAGGLYWSKHAENALSKIILEAGFLAVRFAASIEMVACAFPMLTTMLIVDCTETEGHCLVYSGQQSLKFTYQACPYTNTSDARGAAAVTDLASLQDHQLKSVPDLAVAVLKCLEACPRELRKEAIHNIVFSGRVYGHTVPIAVARCVRDILRGNVSENQTTQPIVGNYSAMELGGRVPVQVSTLKSLSESVSVVQLADFLRPDLLAWLGASLWATYWHENDPDFKRFQ